METLYAKKEVVVVYCKKKPSNMLISEEKNLLSMNKKQTKISLQVLSIAETKKTFLT